MPAEAKLILPGCFLASAISSWTLLRWHVRMHHQHDRRARKQRDRSEILGRIERQLAVERLVDGERSGRGEQQRVAVGIRLGHRLAAGVAAAAGSILDDELLAEIVGELLRQDARHHVDRAAGRVRIDDADDALGIILRGAWRRQRKERQDNDRGSTQKLQHLLGSLLNPPVARSYVISNVSASIARRDRTPLRTQDARQLDSPRPPRQRGRPP